ncbi:UPF0758 domain-containing protein, partial [Klebsiella pneumoniae]|uniref:UPF0758 domain-containing protein n=1 Tax=Klebsiella pneumoniae TaxID=573 RepID=UPI00359CB2C9
MDGMENLMPREKMLQYGIETLTDVELLALFLRQQTPADGYKRWSDYWFDVNTAHR